MDEVHKSIEELIPKEIIGKEDYRMDSGEYTDRYERVIKFSKSETLKDTYYLHEEDSMIGRRKTILDRKGA